MSKLKTRTALSFFSVLLVCSAAHAHQGENHARPDPLQVASSALELPELINSADLLDQQGRSFKIADLKGRPVLLNFMFTDCPDVCGLQTLQLSKLQKRLATIDEELRPRLLSISLNPESDTPDVLKSYAEKFAIDESNWLFATGDAQSIARLASVFWVGSKAGNDGLIDHRMIVHLLDADLQPVQRYRANPIDIKHISSEINSLLSAG